MIQTWLKSKLLSQRLLLGLGIVWILSIPIAILLINCDYYRFPVLIPMWNQKNKSNILDIKHLFWVSFCKTFSCWIPWTKISRLHKNCISIMTTHDGYDNVNVFGNRSATLLLLLVIAVVVDYCCCCKQVQELATANAYGDMVPWVFKTYWCSTNSI